MLILFLNYFFFICVKDLPQQLINTFNIMSSALENHIKFLLYQNIKDEEAVYLVVNSQQYCGEPIKMICNHRNKKDGYLDVHETTDLYFSELLSSQQRITYYYFKANFEDPEKDKEQITWQGTDDRMQLQFNREVYMKSYCVITDRCDQKEYKMDKKGQPYRHFDKRINRKSMEKIINIKISIIREMPLGQWIFAMLLPNELANDPNEDSLMQAIRTKRTASKKRPSVCKWTINWVLGLDEVQQKYGSAFNIAFFESFYYYRIKQSWKAIFQTNQGLKFQGNLESMAKILEEKKIPYIIDYQSCENGEIINHRAASKNHNYIATKFKYECTDDIDPKKVFAVWVVSPSFPRELMKRNKDDIKIWEIQIDVQLDALEDLKYVFQVKSLVEIQGQKKTIVRATRTQKVSGYRPGNSLYIHSTEPLIRRVEHSYSLDSNYRPPSKYFYYSEPVHHITRSSYTYVPYVAYRPKFNFGNGSFYHYYNSPHKSVNSQTSATSSQTTIQKKINIFNITNKVYDRISYNAPKQIRYASAPEKIIHTTTVRYIERVNEIFSEIKKVERDIESLNNSRIYLNTEIQSGYIPDNFRKYIQPVKLKLIKRSEIELIVDDLQKQRKKLIEKYPSLSQKFTKRQQMQTKDEILEKNITQNSLNIFIIEIITAIKEWGKAQHDLASSQNIVKIIKKYFDIPQKQEIVTICYYLNKYMIQKEYNIKAPHGTSCQQQMQKNLMNQLNKQDYLKLLKSMEILKNNQFYNTLKECVDFPFYEFKRFGSDHIELYSTQPSILLMRTLINFGLIYSLMQNSFSEFPLFSSSWCAELGPYCRQQGAYSNTILLSTLKIIRDKYLQDNKMSSKKAKENEEQMVKVEDECVKELQNITDKKVAGLVNLQLDLKNISKELEENAKSQVMFQMMTKLQKGYEDLLQEFQELDKEEEKEWKKQQEAKGAKVLNPEDLSNKKLCKARDILNHEYLNVVSQLA